MEFIKVPIEANDLKPGQHVFILVKTWFTTNRYWPSDIVTGTVQEVREKAIVINGRVGDCEFSRLDIPKSGIAEIWEVKVNG